MRFAGRVWQASVAGMARQSRPLALLSSAVVLSTTGYALAASPVLEPYTKTPFAEEDQGLTLLGLGLRTKYSWFSVYAYALYAHPSLLSSLSDDALFPHLVAVQAPKLLRLVFQRSVSGTDMQQAIEASLTPRVDPSAAEELRRFCSYLGQLALVQNSQLDFYFRGSVIVTSFNGQVVSEVDSAAVSTALLDVYLGDSPISADFKPSILARKKVLEGQ